jgi:hypothetical protein
MALTDNEKEKTLKRTKAKNIVAGTNERWSDRQKLELVQTWMATGNLALSCRIQGIPEVTARQWKASTWWKTLVEEMKMQEKIELSHRMKRLVEAAHVIVAQRLETGDPVFDQKTGNIVYKPVSMKDAHKVAVDLIDRKKDVDKFTVDDEVTDQRNDDKLERLAERFAELATKTIEKKYNKERTVEVVDVVEKNASVPDPLLPSDGLQGDGELVQEEQTSLSQVR